MFILYFTPEFDILNHLCRLNKMNFKLVWKEREMLKKNQNSLINKKIKHKTSKCDVTLVQGKIQQSELNFIFNTG